jgi:uncharacterized protein involved in tolerance to divalent cations
LKHLKSKIATCRKLVNKIETLHWWREEKGELSGELAHTMSSVSSPVLESSREERGGAFPLGEILASS